MKKGGGKKKGGQFEREVCKDLSLAVSRNQRRDLFWRSAMSGGRATVMTAQGLDNKAQVGDVSAIAPEGAFLTDQFVFECKHVKDLGLHNWMLYGTGPIQRYLTETMPKASDSKRKTVLVARQNGIAPIVVTDAAWIWQREGAQASTSDRIALPGSVTFHNHALKNLHLHLWTDFLMYVQKAADKTRQRY